MPFTNSNVRFVTLFVLIFILKYLREQHHVFHRSRVAKHEFAIAGDIVIGYQETEVIDGIYILRNLDNLPKELLSVAWGVRPIHCHQDSGNLSECIDVQPQDYHCPPRVLLKASLKNSPF